MNRFVEECRREWRRLRVPDAIANEMAADLAADLAEAEAEGASAEDVLGDAVFDARSFAASWAAERGVIAPPQADAAGGRTSMVLLVAGAILVVTMLVGAALVIAGRSGSTEARLAVAAAPPPPRVHFWRPAIGVLPGERIAPAPRRARLQIPVGSQQQFFIGANPDDATRAGWALFVVGLFGTAVVTALAFFTRRPRLARS